MKNIYLILLLLIAQFQAFTQPDLAPDAYNYSFNYNQSTLKLSLTFNLLNLGNSCGSFNLAYIVSQDQIVGPEDYLLNTQPVNSMSSSSVISGIEYNYDFNAGDLPQGTYYLIVVADWNSEIAESNENNNRRSYGSFYFENTTTGSFDQKQNDEVSISTFPNPVHKNLTVNITKIPETKNLSFTLLNESGKVYKLIPDNSPTNQVNGQYTFSIDNFLTGVYSLLISTEYTFLYSKKILLVSP